MRLKTYLTVLFFLIPFMVSNAQTSAGRIYQPGSDGPWFEYSIEDGKPKEYYDSGGPENSMRGNLAYTLLRLKPLNSDSHITIVFKEMDIDKYDELRFYDGLIELNNEANEDGEYEYSWPKNIKPSVTIKGDNAKMPMRIKSNAQDGSISIAFFCTSKKQGWKGMIYCVRNGSKEPSIENEDNSPNFLFQVDPNITLGDEEELSINLELCGVKENQVIQIEDGYGKKDYTIGNKVVRSLKINADPGDIIKIYGDLTSLNASSNKFTKAEIGTNKTLKVLNLSQNRISDIKLDKLPILKELWLTNNKLKYIDLSNLPKLEEFYGSYNDVGELRTNMNPMLSVLACASMGLKELNLNENNKIEILTASNNKFNTLPDFNKLKALKYLDFENCNISNIDISNLGKLKKLDLSENNISFIDISKNKLLNNIDLDDNKLDACTINDLMYILPSKAVNDEATLRIAKNIGSTTCDNSILEGKNWKTNFIGDGTGCNVAYVTIEEPKNGSVKLYNELNNEIASGSKITKNSIVNIETKPNSGYSLNELTANGEKIEGNKFTIKKATKIIAKFTVTDYINGIKNNNICIESGVGVLSITTTNYTKVNIYSISGKNIFSQKVKGVKQVNLPQGIYIVKVAEKSNTMIIK